MTTSERRAASDRIAEAQAAARAALSTNTCPTCGGPVKPNFAIAGWVQCVQFGAVGFRADSSRPACSWQGFTR